MYYNMSPSSEQGNDVKPREQRNIKPNRPTAMYDDVVLSTSQERIDSDFPAKPVVLLRCTMIFVHQVSSMI